MASALGVLPSDVRYGMTLDDALDLFDLWRDEPPVQWMVQSYLGVRAHNAETPVPTPEECSAFLQTMASKARP